MKKISFNLLFKVSILLLRVRVLKMYQLLIASALLMSCCLSEALEGWFQVPPPCVQQQ